MTDAKKEKQKVKEITDRLEEGLKELFDSEKYKSYLNTMSKFHNYSFNNTLLIAMQKPNATFVAGYKAWQNNFERHVNKGEKAIRILAPASYKIKEEQDKLDPVTGEPMLDENGMPQKEMVEVTIPAFQVVSVFDISQTDGKPLPELGTEELISTVEGYEDFKQAVMNVSPVPISFEDIPGESRGFYSLVEKRIAVQEDMSESQTLKTMIHETAHAMLHDQDVDRADVPGLSVKDRNTKEVEAESIAYTVCQHFGIDTSDYSFGYIAGWSSDKDMKELKSSLGTIRKTSSELITGIESQLQELLLDREMMQTQEKESILLVHNNELTEYSLLSVRGMDSEELGNVLSAMSEDDKQSVAAYLESKGGWTTEIANEDMKEPGEYHIDVRFNTDTNGIIDLKAVIDSLPDPAVGIPEMEEYGYAWNEMLPLTKEKALELFDHDLPVYLLYENGTETTVEDRKQIVEHEGIFGIEKEDWENVRDFSSIQKELSESAANKEMLLVYGNSDKYGIYQLKEEPEIQPYHFVGTEALKKLGLANESLDEIKKENYNFIYSGELADIPGDSQIEKLEAIYEKFNIDHPEDFKGHSLSVSDIIVLHQNGETSAHFVDSFGYTEIHDFMREPEEVKEQEMSDEIIDLGDDREQVLKDMQKTLGAGQETDEHMEKAGNGKRIETQSIFSICMNGEESFYENTSGLDADALCKAYGECEKPYVEMAQYGQRIGLGDFASIQQSEKLDFSVEFDADHNEVIISDGEHFEHKGLEEILQNQIRDIRWAEEPEYQLAIEIDQFTYHYDPYEYKNKFTDREEGINSVYESIKTGDVGDLSSWLIAVTYEDADLKDIERAEELIDKLKEYKPLAKVEELEEQNYNMIDNVLNNGGGEKAQREAVRKDQDADRSSLKDRLAEKKTELEERDRRSPEAQKLDKPKGISVDD